jgi:histidine ammonia-lyase
MSGSLSLSGRNLTLARLRRALGDDQRLVLATAARARIRASRRTVDRLRHDPTPHYGINTGFGILAHHPRARRRHRETPGKPDPQPRRRRRRTRSPAEIVQLMLLLKINALAVGLSACVTERVVDYLMRFTTPTLSPVVYAKGSLGASGDLAPLAHMVLPLLGLGEMDLPRRKTPPPPGAPALGLKPLGSSPRRASA